MQTSTLLMNEVQRLAAAGHDAAIIEFLGSQEQRELENSPSLALLYGTAQARLGRKQEGLRWLDFALEAARKQEDRALERRAINARGAIALAAGRLDEAADYFTQGIMIASRDGDLATTGRCSNNLGIINSLRGRHAEALGSWEIALAAFTQTGMHEGAAECCHNMSIVHREQGNLEGSLARADLSVAEAVAAGDEGLEATARRGRAERRIVQGDLEMARAEMEAVAAIRKRVLDPVREAEDLRVVAVLLAAEGHLADAEQALLAVIDAAQTQGRPHLRGEATRDLAAVLRQAGRPENAQIAMEAARAIFLELGATGELRQLERQDARAGFTDELHRSLEPLQKAQALADAGRYAELVTFMEQLPRNEIEQSPTLCMLSGIAHGRLGQLTAAWQWALAARARSRALGDRTTEVRALNVCGAIALERGGIGEATEFFTAAQEQAMREKDMTSVGRCANNLGIVANLTGDYPTAVGAYTRAMGAYQQAAFDRGIAESLHNLAITYREQGRLDDALQTADDAMTHAEQAGDELLKAQALAGRAEIRVARGEPDMAIREAEQALSIHRRMQDPVRETEDLRILADAIALNGETARAEALLRHVVERARESDRTHLVAASQRDLAWLMARQGRTGDAERMARSARNSFEKLGAKAEIAKLEPLLLELGERGQH
jgi:tetratricopeptide (TPR) repeat protein